MNGTVNPLYGGNNMNGGAVNDLFIQEQQTKNLADYLTSLSFEHDLPIVILGKQYKENVEYNYGSPSILISKFCNCTFDDLSKPAVCCKGTSVPIKLAPACCNWLKKPGVPSVPKYKARINGSVIVSELIWP